MSPPDDPQKEWLSFARDWRKFRDTEMAEFAESFHRVTKEWSEISLAWSQFRDRIFTTVGLLTSELIQTQKTIDKNTDELTGKIEKLVALDAEKTERDQADRVKRQQHTDRFNWVIVVLVALLFVEQFVLVAFILGRFGQ